MNDITNSEKFEHCVMCGTLTDVQISTPVEWRENYEIGLGQICAGCAKKMQNETRQRNTLLYKQILLTAEQNNKSK